MYCPNCGTPTSSDRKFCRSCGMNLLPVSQMLVTGQQQGGESVALQKEKPALPRNKTFRWGFGIMWAGLLLILMMGIGGDALRHLNRNLGSFIEDLAGIGVIPLLGGVGIMIYSRFLERSPAPPHAPVGSLPPERHVVTFDPVARAEPAPSVTEGTTYSLDLPENSRRP